MRWYSVHIVIGLPSNLTISQPAALIVFFKKPQNFQKTMHILKLCSRDITNLTTFLPFKSFRTFQVFHVFRRDTLSRSCNEWISQINCPSSYIKKVSLGLMLCLIFQKCVKYWTSSTSIDSHYSTRNFLSNRVLLILLFTLTTSLLGNLNLLVDFFPKNVNESWHGITVTDTVWLNISVKMAEKIDWTFEPQNKSFCAFNLLINNKIFSLLFQWGGKIGTIEYITWV